jgi:hypothetical protein
VSGQETVELTPKTDSSGALIAFVYELRLRLIFGLHESGLACHKGITSTLSKALNRLWWKQISQDVKDFCERCVVYRRAKTYPQMVAALDPLHVLPRSWHIVGLYYLTHLHVSDGFDIVLIVDDHPATMANFLPRTQTVKAQETASVFQQGVYILHGVPQVLVSDRDPKFISGFWHTL